MKRAIPLNGHIVIDCTVEKKDPTLEEGKFTMNTLAEHTKSSEGIVKEVADDVTSVKVGDRVLMKQHATYQQLRLEDETSTFRDIIIMKAEDVACKLIEA